MVKLPPARGGADDASPQSLAGANSESETVTKTRKSLPVISRRARWLVRPAAWLWAVRWTALQLRWHTGRRVTIRHYFDFGEDRRLVGERLVRPEAWDAIRMHTDGPFSLPEGRREWEQMADGWEEGRLRAVAIDRVLHSWQVNSLASYGVGGGFLELWLTRLRPKRSLVITDYAPATVARLTKLFREAEVCQHDLLSDEPIHAEAHLFGRVDTEFSDRQWRSIFRRFSDRRILLVATEVIDLQRATAALRLRQTDPNATWAGFIRNRAAFEALWRSTHRSQQLRFGDLKGWALEPRG
jgi:hypothetical protein